MADDATSATPNFRASPQNGYILLETWGELH